MTDQGHEGNGQSEVHDTEPHQVTLNEIPQEVIAEWESRTAFAAAVPPENPAYHNAFREFTARRRGDRIGGINEGQPTTNYNDLTFAPPQDGGLTLKPKIIQTWLDGEEITPGNAQVYYGFLNSNQQHFPQAAQLLATEAARLAEQRQLHHEISDDKIQTLLSGVFRVAEMNPLLKIAHDYGPGSYVQQVLAPSLGRALQLVGKYAAGNIWEQTAYYYHQHGRLPGRETLESLLQTAVEEGRLTPNLFSQCGTILNCCYATEGEIDVEAAWATATQLLTELLYVRPIGRVANYWDDTGQWITEAQEHAEALRSEIQELREQHNWPAPEPLDGPGMPEFPTDHLPNVCREWIEGEATYTQTPVDLSAMLVLAVCAAALAKRMEVRVRADYIEPLNLFIVVVLESGNRKSAVFRDVTEPTRVFEEEQAQRLRPQVNSYENDRQILADRLKRLQKNAANQEDREARRQLRLEADQIAEELNTLQRVVPLRLIADDCTPEQLEVLMNDQRGRIMVASPEGGVFGMMAGRYSDSVQLGVYLHGHSGDDLRTDRISRAAVYIHNPALTMGLAVQPHVIHGLGKKPDLRGQGLLARFLYAIPKSTVGRRDVSPPPVPNAVKERYQRLIRELWELGNSRCVSRDGDQDEALLTRTVEFSPEAINVFDDFVRGIEARMGVCGDLAAMRDWGSKLPGAVARIAGVIHAITQAERHWQRLEDEREQRINTHERTPRFTPWDTTVSPQTVESAIAIGYYLIEHAKIAFGMMGAANMPAVARIADAQYAVRWLIEGRRTTFNKRELYKSDKSRFQKAEDADPVIEILINRNIIRGVDEEPSRRGGRPAEKYDVNPQIFLGYQMDSTGET